MNRFTCISIAAILACGTTAMAQDQSGAIKARQGQMQMLALNLGILGGMAKAPDTYDAATAALAAEALIAVTNVPQTTQWPAGSDSVALPGQTRAKPDIWTNNSDFQAKWTALGEAAAAMEAAAADGPAAIGPALGQVGGTCSACHDVYRAPQS